MGPRRPQAAACRRFGGRRSGCRHRPDAGGRGAARTGRGAGGDASAGRRSRPAEARAGQGEAPGAGPAPARRRDSARYSPRYSRPATHVEPTRAVAGTGPIVVGTGASTGDDAVAVPDIRQLKGVGDKFAVVLDGIGLGTVDRLARLNPDEAADADTRLGAFNGRIARDRLVEQCVLLDEGRTTEYEARFGKLGGPILV